MFEFFIAPFAGVNLAFAWNVCELKKDLPVYQKRGRERVYPCVGYIWHIMLIAKYSLLFA